MGEVFTRDVLDIDPEGAASAVDAFLVRSVGRVLRRRGVVVARPYLVTHGASKQMHPRL